MADSREQTTKEKEYMQKKRSRNLNRNLLNWLLNNKPCTDRVRLAKNKQKAIKNKLSNSKAWAG